jgi:hypothetical protein
MNNQNDFSKLFTGSWWVAPDDPRFVQDLGFTMVFTPEPATLLILGLGAAMLGRKR